MQYDKGNFSSFRKMHTLQNVIQLQFMCVNCIDQRCPIELSAVVEILRTCAV